MQHRERAYKKNKHIFVCSENGNSRIKGICIRTNITDELKAFLFFKSRERRPKGTHCALLTHQLLEYPNPFPCSPPFFYFLTLATFCLFTSSSLCHSRSPSCCLQYLPCNFLLLRVSCKDAPQPKIRIIAEDQSEWANTALDYTGWLILKHAEIQQQLEAWGKIIQVPVPVWPA